MQYVYIHAHRKVSLTNDIYTLIYLEVCVYEYVLVSKLYIHTIYVNISINKVLAVNFYLPSSLLSLSSKPDYTLRVHPSTHTYIHN